MYRHLGTEQANILLHEFGLGFILFHDPSDREYLASTEDLVMWLYSPDYRNSNLCKPQTLRVNGPGGPYPQRVAKGIRYRLHPSKMIYQGGVWGTWGGVQSCSILDRRLWVSLLISGV